MLRIDSLVAVSPHPLLPSVKAAGAGADAAGDGPCGLSIASTRDLTGDKGYDIFVEAFCRFATSDQTGWTWQSSLCHGCDITEVFVVNL
jgi:hypothetical protein